VRVYLAYAIVLVFSLVIAVQPATAFNEMGIPFITSCDFVYMAPFSNTDLTIIEFNSARASLIDNETFNMEFPLFADGFAAGPVVGPFAMDGLGIGASTNVLPFGPVNLAFPSIDQTAFQRSEYERTYFFVDTIG
jgi:hypothetical protein